MGNYVIAIFSFKKSGFSLNFNFVDTLARECSHNILSYIAIIQISIAAANEASFFA